MSSTSPPLPLDTRRAAHDRVAPTKQETYCRILAYGRWCGLRGFTTDQLATDWGVELGHVAPRVTELFQAGELILTAKRRRTRSRSLARVYVVKERATGQDHQIEGRPTHRVSQPPAPPLVAIPTPATSEPLFGDLAPERHRDDG